MTFSSYDETDDIEETDDFDDESQDSYLDEEDDDVVDLEDEEEDDLDDAATALSRAFREAAGADTVEDDADEKEDSAEEADDDDAEAAEQLLAEAIDALPDEEDLEVVTPPLEDPSLEDPPLEDPSLEDPPLEDPSLEDPSLEVGFLRPQEQDNLAYTDAVTAYYEDKDYQRAIEKFGEAIENETQHTEGNVTNSNSIVVKAMYWQAEAYVKMQDISQAIVTFENLIQTYQEHYLSLAAQRRTAQLNPK